MDQICRCDDDYDSEHPFTLPGGSASSASASSTTFRATGAGRASGLYASAPSITAAPSFVADTNAAPVQTAQSPKDHHCESLTLSPATTNTTAAAATTVAVSGSNPLTPSAEIQYRLSKISSKSADLAAIRHAQQQAALQELQRIQDLEKAKLKQANERSLNKLLGGLTGAVGGDDAKTMDPLDGKESGTGED
ncbi:hypothetical protein DFQ27_007222 [Actinomortierella ambigua]|uniref:Uncharacterized protein n=1 Tax=Actinomortierella ambigua TaxID=1343610 RepID=A0A9P6QL95_9FUNG|nr:hypothetical protein DFQ27_007222 [Actinomortierella ambigua]